MLPGEEVVVTSNMVVRGSLAENVAFEPRTFKVRE